jgi:hypothetical protein
LCIYYGCLHCLPYYKCPLKLRAVPACAGFTIILPERPASRIYFPHLSSAPAACHTQYYYTTIITERMRIPLSNYELCLWPKPALKPAYRRLWLMAKACTASRNIRRHAPIVVLYYHPQPYVIIQSHCEIAHSVRLVELYI